MSQRQSMEELRQKLELMEEIDRRRTFRKADFFTPYPKQLQFFALGSLKRQRIFMAGNQVGKTTAGAFETMCHATGNYPKWWPGKRFERPTVGWVAGVSSNDVKRVAQRQLCGAPGVETEWGTGMIPREDLIDRSLTRGVSDAVDELQVQHRTGGKKDGVSRIVFKSYEQGRKTFQGDTIDYGWGDEESEKQEVYDEFVTRLRGDGIIFTTFTPLYGPTDFVNSFDVGSMVRMSLDEVPKKEEGGHFTDEERAARVAEYRTHERDARRHGIPMLGSGAIFLTPEDQITEPAIGYVPEVWPKAWGLDFGIMHPFAAALCAWDTDADVVHVLHTIRMKDALSLVHVDAMLSYADGLWVFWPKDGADRDPHGGAPLKDGYRKLGLRMWHEHAHWDDGSMSTEAGVDEWDQREKTGRLKIASHLSELLEERRYYHRKDGLIVKIRDDILSAVRMFLMMKRYARPGNIEARRLGSPGPKAGRGATFARGTVNHPDGEMNPWTGA